MSVREYIGARYIPLFSDPLEWDSTRSYEPLTVVKNQGSSYVSRQYVPEGVAITNEQYWILWADFNAQLEQYRAEVQRFDGRITANATAIADEVEARAAADTALTGDIAAEKLARETADTALSGDISAETRARKAADTALQNDIDAINLRESCILMLGDSYAQGVHAQSATESGNNWQDLLISRLGLTDVYKYKGGSAGFIARSTSTGGSSSPVPTNTTYNEILNYAYDYINGLGRSEDVRHIIIQGGVNDSNQSDLSNLTSAVRTCVENMHAKFPNAIVHIVYTTCGTTEWASSYNRCFTVPNSYKNGARAGGATYDQFTNISWVRDDASYDGSHPTNASQDILAGFMANVLNGNAIDLSGVFSTGTNGLTWKITEDHYIEYMSNFINAGFVNNAWTSEWPDIYSASAKRAFGRMNMDIPCAFTSSGTNDLYVGIFRFYVNGRVRWVSKGAHPTANPVITGLTIPALRIPIG